MLIVGVIGIPFIIDDNLEFKVDKINFAKCNLEGISYLLEIANFTEFFENNEIGENLQWFYSILFVIFKKCVPKSKIYESAKIPRSNNELRNHKIFL